MDTMFDKLENLLNEWTYPIKRELFMRAITTLESHGTYRAWTEISQYIEYSEEPTSQRLDTIESILLIDVDRILEEHSIITQTTLDVKITILEAILTIQVIEDSETILRLLDSSDNEMDVFIELLSFASNKPWEYFSDGILSVSPSLCVRLREVIENSEAALEAMNIPPNEKTIRLNKFIEKYPNSMTTNEMINEMTLIGTPLNILQDRFKTALNFMADGGAKGVAQECVGLVLLSDVEIKDLQTAMRQQPDYFFSDIRFITDVCFEIDNIIREVFHG